MRRAKVFWTILALLTCAATSHAQAPSPLVAVPSPPPPAAAKPMIGPSEEKVIRQLLDVTGTVKLSQQMVDQMLASMQTSMPDIPAEFWTKIRACFKADEFIALIIPVYDKYYSKEELDGLLAFYQSPLGQKVIATLPEVNRESMAIGQAWGRKQAQAIMTEIDQEREAATKHSETKATTM